MKELCWFLVIMMLVFLMHKPEGQSLRLHQLLSDVAYYKLISVRERCER